MAEKSYVVTAACAVVYSADGKQAVTLPKGAAVPPGCDPEHVALLEERGLITEGDPVGGIASDPDAPPPFTVAEEPKRSGRAAKAADKADGEAPAEGGQG